ncbi:MAG: phytoene desaturase family protein, partial [Armatimonadota bacterium]|nr:phytoene desaturase family protein [Armatimonadota bacterium]
MGSEARRAVVIGAGLGGLATALRLAARGWRVVVCEQHTAAGGKMGRWSAGGFTLDTGPSLITMPHVFHELFRDLGERWEDWVELVPVSPVAKYHFADGTHFYHTTHLPDWLETVRALEGDAHGFLRYLAFGARVLEVSREAFFRRSPFDHKGIPPLRALRHLPLGGFFGNYHALVQRHFRTLHLRQMFDRYPTYVGSSPYATPAMLSVIPAIEILFGGWHVRGGLYRLVEALLGIGERLGVEVRTGARVERICRQDARVTGVVLEGGELLPAGVVVMNGDASTTGRLLAEPHWRPLPERSRSLSGLVFLFAVSRTLHHWPHHQVVFSSNYAQEFAELFLERRFPTEPTVYLNTASRTDRTLVPGDGETVMVMANAPANDTDPWDEAAVSSAWGAVRAR